MAFSLYVDIGAAAEREVLEMLALTENRQVREDLPSIRRRGRYVIENELTSTP